MQPQSSLHAATSLSPRCSHCSHHPDLAPLSILGQTQSRQLWAEEEEEGEGKRRVLWFKCILQEQTFS